MSIEDFGIKVVKPGANILTIEDRDIIFSSKYFAMKTYLVGTIPYQFPSDLTNVELVITHNLGYPLSCWFSFDGSNQNSQWIGSDFWATYYDSGGGNRALRAWTLHSDANEIRIVYEELSITGAGYNPTGELWNFKYYAFIEPSA